MILTSILKGFIVNTILPIGGGNIGSRLGSFLASPTGTSLAYSWVISLRSNLILHVFPSRVSVETQNVFDPSFKNSNFLIPMGLTPAKKTGSNPGPPRMRREVMLARKTKVLERTVNAASYNK